MTKTPETGPNRIVFEPYVDSFGRRVTARPFSPQEAAAMEAQREQSFSDLRRRRFHPPNLRAR
jgi:hypothetical protein